MGVQSWRRLSATERRDQLLEVGVELFNEQLYDAISVDDIARAAGISKGLLYHYFPSKERFFLAATEAGARELLAATETDRSAPFHVQVLTAIRGYLGYVQDNAIAYQNIFHGESAGLPGIGKVCDETRATFRGRILEQLPEPVKAGLATQAAVVGFQGMFEALVLRWLQSGELSRDIVEVLCVSGLMSAMEQGMRLDLERHPELLPFLQQARDEARAYFILELGDAFQW